MGLHRVTRNDDPPDESGAFELLVKGQWFAWDENNNVYQWCKDGKHTDRDDGYNWLGMLMPAGGEEYSPRAQLNAFAIDYMYGEGRKHWRKEGGCYCVVCLAPVEEKLFVKRDGACPCCNPGDDCTYK